MFTFRYRFLRIMIYLFIYLITTGFKEIKLFVVNYERIKKCNNLFFVVSSK